MVVFAIRIEVLKHTTARERISNSVEKKDGNDEEGKHFIGETSGILENPVEVDKGSHNQIHSDPNANPSVKGQERNSQGSGKLKANRLKGKNGSSTSIDTHGHTADEGIDCSVPTRRQHEFDHANVITRTTAVDCTKGNGRSNGGNVHEELQDEETSRV